jgi:hypothetical protein
MLSHSDSTNADSHSSTSTPSDSDYTPPPPPPPRTGVIRDTAEAVFASSAAPTQDGPGMGMTMSLRPFAALNNMNHYHTYTVALENPWISSQAYYSAATQEWKGRKVRSFFHFLFSAQVLGVYPSPSFSSVFIFE